MTTVIQDLVAGLSLGGLYALFALGIALIFGVAGIMNFAQGAMIAVSAYVLFGLADLPWPLLALATVVSGIVLAVLLEAVVFRRARGADQTTLLIMSFGVGVILQAALVLIAGSEPHSVTFGASLNKELVISGLSIPRIDLLTLVTAVVLMVALGTFLRRTTMGIQLRAAAEDFRMARHLGVRVNRVMLATFALSGLLAGVSTVLITARSGTLSPTMGFEPVLVAFVATVIGGLGSIYGAAAGGMVLGLLTILLQVVLPAGLQPYRDAILFSIVIFVLLVRPEGIIPTARAGTRV
ncbi:MAG: branched-chain amino acid ABC transporter permease [Actinobacteria bacterium]|nr:branched-chain amino acid ABC transporter permease [Actinomycetota bacterium]